MNTLFSYIVKVDSGFAPNPFHGYCTLATCKPRIRKAARIGDWVIGTGSKTRGRNGRLVYAMHVCEAMTFDEYWNDSRFRAKRPNTSSDKEDSCGDNIYYRDPKWPRRFCQVPSYHSCPDGRQDYEKLERDTKEDKVLISDDFVYWGGDGPVIPEFSGINVCHTTQHHKRFDDNAIVMDFIAWVRSFDASGCLGKPLDF